MRVCDMLLSSFRLFCRKPGREPAASISTYAAGSQQVRWFLRVLDKWNVEKPVLTKFAAGFRHAFDLLWTTLRHAHASLRLGVQPGLQLATIMECDLKQTYLLCVSESELS